MKNHNSGETLVFDMPSSDLARAQRLIVISISLWICVGILAALQGHPFA